VFQKNYFSLVSPQLLRADRLTLINRKRLPLISASEYSPLTKHGADGLFTDQVTAGQLASLCHYWAMSNGGIWQDGMSVEGATVRMRLEIRRRDIPFARGQS
jgi:hypothetical protein